VRQATTKSDAVKSFWTFRIELPDCKLVNALSNRLADDCLCRGNLRGNYVLAWLVLANARSLSALQLACTCAAIWRVYLQRREHVCFSVLTFYLLNWTSSQSRHRLLERFRLRTSSAVSLRMQWSICCGSDCQQIGLLQLSAVQYTTSRDDGHVST